MFNGLGLQQWLRVGVCGEALRNIFWFLKSLFSGFEGTETITSGALVVPDYTGTLQSVPADTVAVTGARWTGTEFVDHLTDGTPLQPSKTLNAKKIPLYYPPVERSTAYAVGDKRSTVGNVLGSELAGQDLTAYLLNNPGSAVTSGTNFLLADDVPTDFTSIDDASSVVVAGDNYYAQIRVLKDSDESRFPEFSIKESGGSAYTNSMQLNTKTGVGVPRLVSTISAAFAVVDDGDYWKIILTGTMSAGTTGVYWRIFPAISSVIGSVSTATTGSIITSAPSLKLATSETYESYYSVQTAGTTDATAPTFATSGDTIDGGVTWAYQGYHTIKGVDVWPVRTNSFLNSNAPVTQDITTAAQDYTINVLGTGDITVSGSATGTATEGSPLTVSAAAGTLTCTVNGTVTRAQVEDGSFATPWIDTTTATVTRASTNITLPTAGVLPVNDFGIMGMVNPGASGQSNNWAFSTYIELANYLGIYTDGASLKLYKQIASSPSSVSAGYDQLSQAVYQAYQSATYGMGIRVYNTSTQTWSAWSEKNDADGKLNAPIASVYELGMRNSLEQFAGNYLDTMIIQSSDPKADLMRLATQLGY